MGKALFEPFLEPLLKPFLEPSRNCDLCPRLKDFRLANRRRFPDWHNAPVPSFGERRAALAVIGLAPGLSGANRTGRPFTGDAAGDLLYATLQKVELAHGHYSREKDDDLTLTGCRIVNVLRCVPPENKPLPDEIAACRPFFHAELKRLRARVFLALGGVAHRALLDFFALRPYRDFPFKHAAEYRLEGAVIVDSYHCSRRNTSRGILSALMFEKVVRRAKALSQKI